VFTEQKAPSVFYKQQLLRGWLSLLLCCFFAAGGYAQEQLPSFKLNRTNQLSSDWLIYRPETNHFSLYIPEYHGQTGALYQWVDIRSEQPFVINFTAKKDLSLFIDNQLLFTADSVATYSLDLNELFKPDKPGRHLLCIWHPTGQPDYTTFTNASETRVAMPSAPLKNEVQNKVRHYPNYNAFIIFLLLIGVLYGSLRTSYTSDFQSLFRVSNFFRHSALEEGLLAKPISSWSSILFVIAFSLSFALVIVAIHTNIQNIVIFNRLFAVSETDITSRILFYTFLVFSFILLKYLFLSLMGYIFDLTPLVSLQYREFIRSLLCMGVFLPLIMVLYLALNTAMPQFVLFVSNVAVSIILVVTGLRIAYTVNKKVLLRNLHLFSYICATEIIPLIILLKLIVFNY